jgi:hypothetical protein
VSLASDPASNYLTQLLSGNGAATAQRIEQQAGHPATQ